MSGRLVSSIYTTAPARSSFSGSGLTRAKRRLVVTRTSKARYAQKADHDWKPSNQKKKRKARSHRFFTVYQKYLRSEHWRTLRFNIILERGYRCERCGSIKDIHLHHKTYARLGCELPTDVMLLCWFCHGDAHPQAMQDQLREADFIAVEREKRNSQLARDDQESDGLKAAATGWRC